MATNSNHLINEKSPYLLQHADNPVDWYPWSDEAFNKAKKEDKPVFLSIGYSTCHWCHVMEEESFEDEEVAQILNQNFIAIKVDREERPDVDSIYMEVCQSLTGRGGWPLTVIMTPEKEPFFAGTYFPKQSKRGQPGLINILNKVAQKWRQNKEELVSTGQQIVDKLSERSISQSKQELSDLAVEKILTKGFETLQSRFDNQYGGFGAAPKFPQPHNLLFLLRYSQANDNQAALEMVTETLNHMHQGGIYDQLGYGFARYSTDRKWLVPHFEKMLYDNALLAITYLEAYQLTSQEDYKAVAEEILHYVKRDMTAPEGGFYSAEDADSEGEEGKFYLWTPEEVKEVLGAEKGEEFCAYYDITAEGNFEGSNIPNLIGREERKVEIDNKFKNAKQKLFAYRENRIHPAKDDKILTAWNGLMIAAFSLANRLLDNEDYQEQAEKTVEFIQNNLINDEGRLLARYRAGEADYLAYVDDYAFLIWGLIELYQSSFKVEYLELALDLNEDLLEHFWDDEAGGLYLYGDDGEELITRPKKIRDGALPSGNAIAAFNFWRLAQLTANEELYTKFEKQINAFKERLEEHPIAHTASLISLFQLKEPGQEIVVNTEDASKKEEFLKVINNNYLPFSTVVLNSPKKRAQLAELNDFFAANNFNTQEDRVLICQNYTCQSPIYSPEELKDALD